MTILYIIIGMLIGAVSAWIVAGRKASEKAADRERSAVQQTIELEKRNTELGLRNEQLQHVTERLAEVERENKSLMGRTEWKPREIEILRRQAVEEANMRSEQFAEQLRTAKEQIANMAGRIMEQNARKLKEENTENIGNITQPLKDAISEMRKAITDNIKDSAQNSASFREQIGMISESNREIGEKAESLTNVLRRDNKAAGNMGEIILGDLLASQGLTEGIHYEVQARLRDETGRALKTEAPGARCSPKSYCTIRRGRMPSSTLRCRLWLIVSMSMPILRRIRTAICRIISKACAVMSMSCRARTTANTSRHRARLSTS